MKKSMSQLSALILSLNCVFANRKMSSLYLVVNRICLKYIILCTNFILCCALENYNIASYGFSRLRNTKKNIKQIVLISDYNCYLHGQ